MKKKRSTDPLRATALEEEVKGYAPPGEYETSVLTLGKLSKASITKLSRAILAFGEAMCDVSLHPYQKDLAIRIIQSALLSDSEEVTGLFSRQSGKTETLAVVINALMVMLPVLSRYIQDRRVQKYAKGCWIGIFAPSYDQASIMYNRAYNRLHSDHAATILADHEIGIEFDDRRMSSAIKLPNGSFADCNSAAKQARIEGKTYHLIITEESQDIDISVFKKSISPMGAAVAASYVKIGTCNMVRSDFYEACLRNASRDSQLKRGELQNHFQNDYEVAMKYNPWYRQHIKKEINRLGFESDEFRMAYRLHWILEGGMFIDPSAFAFLGRNYSPVTYDSKNAVVVGIDVGKADASTVVTAISPDYGKGGYISQDDFRCHKKILNWLQLRGDDYVQQFAQIKDFLSNYKKLVRVEVDATGVGQMMYDLLKDHFKTSEDRPEELQVEVIGTIATAQSNHDLYQRMLVDLQNGWMEYPDSDRAKSFTKQRAFVLQMTNLQKDYRGSYLGAVAGELTPYKDYCSSYALASHACDGSGVLPEIETHDEVFSGGTVRGSSKRGLASERGRAKWR